LFAIWQADRRAGHIVLSLALWRALGDEFSQQFRVNAALYGHLNEKF
jgi:hypothetical protein